MVLNFGHEEDWQNMVSSYGSSLEHLHPFFSFSQLSSLCGSKTLPIRAKRRRGEREKKK